MQAKLTENGIDVPSMLKPEKPGDQDENMEDANKESHDDHEDHDDDDDYDFDSDDSDNCEPIPGDGLLEQIFHLQNKESANQLGISMKTKSRTKPLAKNNADKQNKLGVSARPDFARTTKSNPSSKKSKSTQSNDMGKLQKLERQRVEHDKLFRVVEDAFTA